MMLLDGQVALSPFRLERLNARLAAIAPDLALQEARHLYLVEAEAGATPARERLAELLDADAAEAVTAPRGSGATVLWVVPRLGTISPWSSKATEILRGCDLPVHRVERGLRLELRGWRPEIAARAARELHDPMTQSLLEDATAIARVFAAGAPGAIARVVLAPAPKAALDRANRELGLALSDDEIEYLVARYAELGRDPSDAELMMFAQANSEHCRHKVFNATWRVDGREAEHSLFGMIKHTHATHPDFTLSAYKDNAAVISGSTGQRLVADPVTRQWRAMTQDIAYAIKVETHNHPTAISPFPGASTGSGGEIRDEGATGRGAKPKAGLTGFSVSHLRIPGLPRAWELPRELPPRMASAFEIMRDGPLGAAAFNNEFGRPALLGYFRSFEMPTHEPRLARAYDKPIMLAGGVANIRADHVRKHDLSAGDAIIVLGGPAMLIGLGGGAASSVAGGESSEALDFASVQRDNPEMQRRCQEVIDRCWSMGDDNPIVSVHDVGAGGLSNAIPELLNDSSVGGRIELTRIPCADPQLSPMQIWCNESQERYVLGISQARLAAFEALCARERCPYAVVGTATAERHLLVSDARDHSRPIDLPMDVLFGKPPRMHRDTQHVAACAIGELPLASLDLQRVVPDVLRHPSVGSKAYLVTIGDRTVGGLCSRDQMVGPWQVPVADCAVTLVDFDGHAGEAMSIGERTPLALISSAAAARMAVGEALTNLAAAPIAALAEVRLSANWMAAVSHPGEDAALFDAVRAVGLELCPALGVSIPVGKDSLSMQARWRAADGEHRAVSPVSLIVSAFARVDDARRALTPQLRDDAGDSVIVFIDLAASRARLGGSILAQMHNASGGEAPDVDEPAALKALFDVVQTLNRAGLVLAYHDRSDGGVIAALAEMAFAGRVGLDITVAGEGAEATRELLNEELGALLQVRVDDLPAVDAIIATHGLAARARRIATPRAGDTIRVLRGERELASWSRADLIAAWGETSHAMQRLRDDPRCADEEYAALRDNGDPGLRPRVSFDLADDVAAPYILRGHRPRVAVLREQGVNGQVEMAAVFMRAGFDADDVHMTDLIEGRARLSDYAGFVACGGFSYGDVLGAGRGWATSIRYRPRLAEQFAAFLADTGKFALGVCNGCQMLAALKTFIPGAEQWPSFARNRSEQFEARLSLVEVLPSPSLFLRDMAGSRLPVAVAHGEGRAVFERPGDEAAAIATLRFVDGHGEVATRYPANPNGSPGGMTGFTTRDGRVTIMMPHPERVHRALQVSWHPREWTDASPWLRMFRNARVWLG